MSHELRTPSSATSLISGKLFWPAKLAAFYPFPASLPWYEVVGAASVLIAITALVARRPREPYLLAGWLWFLGTLVPMIGIVQVGGQAMADRYAYLPSLGILVMFVWGIADLLHSRRLSPTIAIVGSFVVLAGLAFAFSTRTSTANTRIVSATRATSSTTHLQNGKTLRLHQRARARVSGASLTLS